MKNENSSSVYRAPKGSLSPLGELGGSAGASLFGPTWTPLPLNKELKQEIELFEALSKYAEDAANLMVLI